MFVIHILHIELLQDVCMFYLYIINLSLYFPCFTEEFFVTWGARHDANAPSAAAGAPLPPNGKPLGKLLEADLQAMIEKGIRLYGMCPK